MSLILSAAHFLLCGRCKRHGRIILADGSRRIEVASKEDALRDLEHCKLEVVVTAEEVPILVQQIGYSDLPRMTEDADILNLICVELANFLRADSASKAAAKAEKDKFPRGVRITGLGGTA